jgi:HPt (histidine-containing phosphotransfer) domain-containing protein
MSRQPEKPMSERKAETPAVTAYHDHEVITPPNKLRKAWVQATADDQDPVARAEQALADISTEFGSWMESECARLDAARRDVRSKGFDPKTIQALFHAAHDIKGEAETFGFPLAAAAADSLCRLIEMTPQSRRLPLVLVDQHVDAVRAIVREHELPHAETMAANLTEKLRQVTEEFLRSVGAEAPDMASPPTAPPK